MILEIGQTFGNGNYRAESFIAEGGMAEVWRVRHLPSGRMMAAKFLRASLVRQSSILERFRLEFDLLDRLRHPNIIHAEEFGWHTAPGDVKIPWFSMDYFPYTFEQRMGGISIGEGIKAIIGVLEALEFAHGKGIVHRDLKPVNIMVDKTGRVVLSDFGIAKESASSRNLTGRAILGTPYYLSPEQCLMVPVSPPSDIYSIGVILFRLCAGRLPFERASQYDYVRAHINDKPPMVDEVNAAISKPLAEIIAKCLEKKPEDRFPSARELIRRLARCDELREAGEHMLRPGQGLLEGRYEVVNRIEQGGFAEVYRVRDTKSGKIGALKICLSQLAYAPNLLHRFEQEISILKRLNHPGIVKIVDSGYYPHTHAELPFFVMPYYPGTLQTSLNDKADPNKAMKILMQVLEALAYAHRYEGGVYHRDLKPSNILIDGEGRASLIDFGIAKVGSELSAELTRNATVTRTVFGSSYYMAPEQIKNEPIDQRTDIYSMGVILYEVATGRRLFEGRSGEQIIAMHLYEAPAPPRKVNARVSRPLQEIILRCLQKKPPDRYPTVADLIKDLKSAGKNGKWFGPAQAEREKTGRRIPMGALRFGGGFAAGAVLAFALVFASRAASGGSGGERIYRDARNGVASASSALVLTIEIAREPTGSRKDGQQIASSATPEQTPEMRAVVKPQATPELTPEVTPDATPAMTPIATATPMPTFSPTPMALTPTPRPTAMATPTPSPTPMSTPTRTPRATMTPKPTPKPTATPKPTPKMTPTPAPALSKPEMQATPTPEAKPMKTETPTPTPSPSPTPTPRPAADMKDRIGLDEAQEFARKMADVLSADGGNAKDIFKQFDKLCHPSDPDFHSDFLDKYSVSSTERADIVEGRQKFLRVKYGGPTGKKDEFKVTVVVGKSSDSITREEDYNVTLVRYMGRVVLLFQAAK